MSVEIDNQALAARYVELIEEYPEDERPKVTTEIVKQVAEEYEIPPNSVRMRVTKAGVYVKQASAKSAASGETKKATGGARTSKAQAHAELKAAMADAGIPEDKITEGEEVIEKMTGKAALFLAEAIRSITK